MTSLCEPITIPLCQESIPYNKTMFPNLFGQEAQGVAAIKVHEFYPLVQVNCSPQLRLLLCALYAPICTDS